MAGAIFDEVAYKLHNQFSWHVRYSVKFNQMQVVHSVLSQYLVKFNCRHVAAGGEIMYFSIQNACGEPES